MYKYFFIRHSKDMLPFFEKSLARHNVLAKDRVSHTETAAASDPLLQQLLSQEANSSIAAAKKYGGSSTMIQNPKSFVRSERRVFKIQVEKQQRMKDLRAMLEAIRRGDDEEVARYLPKDAIQLRQERGSFFYEQGEEVISITRGMLFADLEWERVYRCPTDPASRVLARKYALEYIRRELRVLAAGQLIAKGLSARSFQLEQRLNCLGWFAEDVLRSSLQKHAIDRFPALYVRHADTDEDALITADLILEVNQHERAVAVVPSASMPRKRFAIQLKWTDQNRSFSRKSILKQIRNHHRQKMVSEAGIVDIIEVGISLPELEHIRDAWIRKPVPGGADRYLSADKHAELFAVVMHGILPPDELRVRCDEVKRYYEEYSLH